MFRKILLWLLAILVVVLVVSVIFIKNNKPVYSGTISLEALEEKVTVYFDEYALCLPCRTGRGLRRYRPASALEDKHRTR